ncbi:uncharacterized protein ISCGN_031675 [Ixodes scapularis]
MQPFSVVEHEDFLNMVTRLAPTKTPLTRRALMERIAARSYKTKQRLLDELGRAEHIAITTDCWKSFNRCAAHTLNLVASVDAQRADHDKDYRTLSQSVFGKCQSLWTKQNQSTLAADEIHDLCGRYLVVPNATRWNSRYDAMRCLQGILEEKPQKLEELCLRLKLPILRRLIEADFINEYCEVMKPIANALDILQADDKMYLGYLLPTITATRRRLAALSGLQYCRPLKSAITDGIEKRFAGAMDDTALVISAALIPRFKLQWVPEADRDRVIQLLKTEVSRLPRREHHVTSDPPATGEPEDFFSFNEEGHCRRDSEAQDVMLYLQ